jgi:hypothetical protein
MEQLNLDLELLNLRESKYDRNKCIIEMCKKHHNKKCNCNKKNKKCNCSGIIDLNKFNDELYISEVINSGQFDTMYNIILSITNSLKSSAGIDFEKCIEQIFTPLKI